VTFKLHIRTFFETEDVSSLLELFLNRPAQVWNAIFHYIGLVPVRFHERQRLFPPPILYHGSRGSLCSECYSGSKLISHYAWGLLWTHPVFPSISLENTELTFSSCRTGQPVIKPSPSTLGKRMFDHCTI